MSATCGCGQACENISLVRPPRWRAHRTMPAFRRPTLAFLPSSCASLVAAQTTDAGLRSDEFPACERSVVKIVWSYLAVIFACTWVSVHPNVPGDRERAFDIVWRKLSIMVDALLAPELVLFGAMRQWIGSRELAARYKGEVCTYHLRYPPVSDPASGRPRVGKNPWVLPSDGRICS
jgi:hypothetical protein